MLDNQAVFTPDHPGRPHAAQCPRRNPAGTKAAEEPLQMVGSPPPPPNSYTRRVEMTSTAWSRAVRAAAAALVLLAGALLAGLAPEAARAQTAQTVDIDWTLKPAGIGAGQSFRLLFVTTTETVGLSYGCRPLQRHRPRRCERHGRGCHHPGLPAASSGRWSRPPPCMPETTPPPLIPP